MIILVVSTYLEPHKGWINNFYGPTGYVAGAGLGLIRVGLADMKVIANIIPADMTINFLIASAWDVGTKYEKSNKDYEMQIYNYESSNDKVS